MPPHIINPSPITHRLSNYYNITTPFMPSALLSSQHNLPHHSDMAFLNRWQGLRQNALDEKIPVLSLESAVFLRRLLQQYRPKTMLEIGSAVGVSAAWIGSLLQEWGGVLDTVEISVPTHKQAVNNLRFLGVDNVYAHCGDALLWLANQAKTKLFECVFIDAHKLQSQAFYAACLPYLSEGGLIIVDDAWKFRHKMQAFYQLLQTHNQAYSLHFVGDGDATLLIRPKCYTQTS
jgi:predicted O-methyltransferase YrrM